MENKIEKILSDLQLISEEGLDSIDSFASITLNPTLRWMKFILTDDKPNGNKQRVPLDEFANLINSGVHMPIKMAIGEIKPGHEEAVPLGVITNLKQVRDQIEGLAAVWSRERPQDVEFVISEFKAGRTPQISWEIPYTEIIKNDDGIEDLRGICLRAATLVGLAAYRGRTPILAVASDNKPNTEDKQSMEEIETLKVQLQEAIDKVAALEAQLQEKIGTLASLEPELTQLREYKSQIEKEEQEAAKLVTIKTKFTEAGIQKDDEYFATNKERLLALSDTDLDFMMQELVAFAKASQKPGDDRLEIPNFANLDINTTTKNEVLKALRERNKKR